MARELKASLREPRFLVGLALRLGLLLALQPVIRSVWFLPFLDTALGAPLDPWTAHLASGGSALAFPYGPGMLAALAPLTWLGLGADRLLDVQVFAHWGFGLSILIWDLVLLELLLRLLPERREQALTYYWLSPITLYVCYWHGQVDVVPVALLVGALYQLRQLRPLTAGLLLGVSIATKLSIVLSVPFLLIYLLGNKRLWPLLLPFTAALVGTALALQGPYLASPGVRQAVFGSPELTKIYALYFHLGDGLKLYLLPLVYALVVFGAWRVRRMSFELLSALLGIGFFLVILLTPASPGWFLWVVPFLALLRWERRTMRVLLVAFVGLYLGAHVLRSSGSALPWLGLEPDVTLAAARAAVPLHLQSLWLSTLVAAGILLALGLAQEGVARNDYYRLSRAPLMVGIAGDSGSGKDTLAEGLAGLFGAHSVAQLSGDDYHHWDRGRPMWEHTTHLNPRANDLYQFSRDVMALGDGRVVSAPHYDHETGRFVAPRPVAPNHVILVSGLHALFAPALRERYDLRIYLDMDEGLRRHFKAQRDVASRQHDPENVAAVLERREEDAERFIRPQAARADVVFALQPVSPALLDEDPVPAPLRLKLTTQLRRGLYYEPLVRVLVGVLGLGVEVDLQPGSDEVTLDIEGEPSGADLALAAEKLHPEFTEILDLEPRWAEGMLGVMQLISLAQVAQALRERMA